MKRVSQFLVKNMDIELSYFQVQNNCLIICVSGSREIFLSVLIIKDVPKLVIIWNVGKLGDSELTYFIDVNNKIVVKITRRK